MSEPTPDPTVTDSADGITPDAGDSTPESTPDAEPVEGAICGECWPAGWPESAGADAAHCSHGEWKR